MPLDSKYMLFVGSNSKSPGHNGIKIFHLSLKSHDSFDLQFISALSNIQKPSHITLSHNEKFIFAINNFSELENSRIFAWQLKNEKNEFLESPVCLGSWPIGGTESCYLAIEHRDRFVYVANQGASISAFKAIGLIGTNGELVRCNLFKFQGLKISEEEIEENDEDIEPREPSTNEESTLPISDTISESKQSRITAVHLSPNDDYVYASDEGNDCIWKFYYSRIAGFDFITELPQANLAPPKSGPGRGIFLTNKDGLFLYIGCKNNHILAYTIDHDQRGMLEQIQYIPVLPENEIKNQETSIGVSDIRVSSNSKYLYVASRFRDSISIFEIVEDGSVRLVRWIASNGSAPRDIVLIPNKELLLVANEGSNDIGIFEIGINKLYHKQNLPLPNSPTCITICELK